MLDGCSGWADEAAPDVIDPDLLRHRPLRDRRLPLIPLVAVVGWLLATAYAVDHTTYDIWGAFWVAGALAALTVPIAHVAAVRHDDPRLAQLLLAAFAAKVLVGSVLRYLMVYELYDGGGDAARYDAAGRVLAPLIRHGTYPDLGQISGSRFTEVLTGHVYAVIGPTRLGGFLVFSWLAFVGLWLLVRAFEIAVPDGDHRRYRYLVLFFPTLLFWPSSIGKDAWMLLCIGAAAYGLARMLDGQLRGLVPAALGAWGAAVVRPHIAVLLAFGAGAAVLVRSVAPAPPSARSVAARLRSIVLAAFVLVGVVAAVARTEQFFNLDTLDPESAETFLTDVRNRTGQGESEFDAPDADNPIGFVLATATVLFRPLPVEADSSQTIVASLEGLVLAAVVVLSLGRLARLPALALRRPYVLFALVFSLGFIYIFSAIDNFGIIARQRTQLLPFVFVLLALPTGGRADTEADSERERVPVSWPQPT